MSLLDGAVAYHPLKETEDACRRRDGPAARMHFANYLSRVVDWEDEAIMTRNFSFMLGYHNIPFEEGFDSEPFDGRSDWESGRRLAAERGK